MELFIFARKTMAKDTEAGTLRNEHTMPEQQMNIEQWEAPKTKCQFNVPSDQQCAKFKP